MEEDKEPFETLGAPPAYDPPAYAVQAASAPEYPPGRLCSAGWGDQPPLHFVKNSACASYQPLPVDRDQAASPPPYDLQSPQFGNVPSAPFPVQIPQVVYVDSSGAGRSQYQSAGALSVVDSYNVQLGLACAVTFCCVWPLGLVALALAIAASHRSTQGNQELARKLGRASVGVSIASVVVGIVLICVIIGLTISSNSGYYYSYRNG